MCWIQIPLLNICTSNVLSQDIERDRKLPDSFKRQAIKMFLSWKIHYKDVRSPQINL